MSGAIFALLVGAACWAPLAPTALAPTLSADQVAAANAPVSASVAALVVASLPDAAAVPIVPTPAPRVASPTPAPLVMPTLSAAGRAMLDGIKADRTSQWVKNHTETPLRSGPSDDAMIFTRLPQWSLLKQTDSRPDWLMVQYSGDGDTRQPGPGWVKASAVGAVDAPAIWLSSATPTIVWSAADRSGLRVVDVPRGTTMEMIVSPDFIRGTRVHVRLPGDGRMVPPSQGWVDGDAIARAATPFWFDLPWAYPEDLRADVRINVPYRSQFDGSDYAGANCGPTVLGMGLETFGVNLAPLDLRRQVLDSESFDPDDTDAGSFIWALANVAENIGLKSHGLYEEDGALHHWSVDDIRASLRAGRPVIVQVVYRGLPGRSDSSYYADHYIILTGLLGDRFLYNDPIGGSVAHEAPGYDRVMTAAQLERAMRASDTPYAFSAFGLSR